MDRKRFLQSIAAAGCLPISVLLEGCAPSAQALYVTPINNSIVLPLASIPDLKEPNSFVKIYVEHYANPIIVFTQGDGTVGAVLSTCTHSGCEARKLRTKFECPCHGSEFDLQGGVLKGPAAEPLDTFRVRKFADRLEFSL